MSDLVDHKLMPMRTAAEQFAIAGEECGVLTFNSGSRLYYLNGKGGPCVMAAAEWDEYKVLCARWSRTPLDLHDAPGISMMVVDSEEEAKWMSESRLAPHAVRLDAGDRRRIHQALLVTLKEARDLVSSARGTLSVEDYEDALTGAFEKLSLSVSCVSGLCERAEMGKQKAEIQQDLCGCGAAATCYGSYDGEPHGFACDHCCGHGNEGGRCYPVKCPQCGDAVIKPRDSGAYCENCGWPDEDRAEQEGGAA